MKKVRLTRRVTGLGVAMVLGAATVTVGASPAFASSSCHIDAISCTTGHVLAGGDHAVKIFVDPGWGKATCYVYDSGNGIEVGRVSATVPNVGSKTIPGLYYMYFAVCVQNSGSAGHGTLS